MNALPIESLSQPDYLHVLLNPLPIYGLATATLALAIALLARSRPAQRIALLLIFLTAAAAWPAYLSGEKAYHRIYLQSDADGKLWLDIHMERAERTIYIFYGLAAFALGAALIPIKAPKAALPLTLLTLGLSVAALTAAGWIAHAGGQVRHPEFRPRDSETSLEDAGWRCIRSPTQCAALPPHRGDGERQTWIQPSKPTGCLNQRKFSA